MVSKLDPTVEPNYFCRNPNPNTDLIIYKSSLVLTLARNLTTSKTIRSIHPIHPLSLAKKSTKLNYSICIYIETHPNYPFPTICIVLYLYIYIALLAVHTNQKRFQCERPREKR